MSSSSFTSILEQLPDELLLLVCQYLSSADVLVSFYGLNSRLSQTISDYYQHVVLAQLSLKRFNYICASILPNIGKNISHLVVNNDWKGVLSKSFLCYFGEKMSLTFPNLKHVKVAVFNTKSLTSFLECLENLTELSEINIHQLFIERSDGNEIQTLLRRLLTVNNNRLDSIIFDCYSNPFPITMQNTDVSFSNIKKLHINLRTINDLHQLLTILPKLSYLYTQIHNSMFQLEEQNEYATVSPLTYFHLRSFCHSWSFEELASIIKRLPDVEELAVAIDSSNDIELINGTMLRSLFSSLPLRKFDYFVQFHDFSRSVDHEKMLATWQHFEQNFVCIKCDENKVLLLYTIPFAFPYLILKQSIAKNEVFMKSYASKVNHLILYRVPTHMIDIFPVIKKCHRIQTLELRISGGLASKPSQPVQLERLPYLTEVVLLHKLFIDTDYFRNLLEVSPNLYHLEIHYEFLLSLMNNKSLHLLLEQRIKQIYIILSTSITLESVISSISRIASIFPSLKHLYFRLDSSSQSTEPLILAVLNSLPKWTSLISFGVVDAVMTEETLSKDIPQWIIENSILSDRNSFMASYTDETFRLWL